MSCTVKPVYANFLRYWRASLSVYFYNTKTRQSFAIALKQKESHASLNVQTTLFNNNNMTNKFSVYLHSENISSRIF